MSSHHHRQPESGINNDNGNTELPSIALVTNDSNDTFVGTGTLLGEVSLPNKFLSAKNSIEIHKNKVLTLNQSMPNVVQDRNHCLNNLISQNHGHSSNIQPFLRSFLPPFSKPERSNDHDNDYLKHTSSQKSAKTVNWAPVLSGQDVENMAAPRASNTNAHIIHIEMGSGSGTFITSDSHGGTVSANLGSGLNSGGENNVNRPELDFKIPESSIDDPADHHPQDISFTTIARQVDSRTSLKDRLTTNEELAPNSPSVYKELFYHKTPSPDDTLSVTDTEDVLALSANVDVPGEFELDGNFRSSCLFLPPAENYVINAHVDSNNVLVNSTSQKLPQRLPSLHSTTQVSYRDQHTGSDMGTLTTTDNNLENHNYDTDDELCETNAGSQVLTMVNPNDLPVPDPEYVARMVPPELHPFIAKKCKKDCRTWLWKSRSQRETYLAKQKIEQEKENSADSKKS